MKKVLLILGILFVTMSNAQENKQVPMINVPGEGKVNIAPDQALI